MDLTKVAEYTAKAAKAGGPEDASLGMLWRKLSELPVVTIAKLRGKARGAGSELALACECVSLRGRMLCWANRSLASVRPRALAA